MRWCMRKTLLLEIAHHLLGVIAYTMMIVVLYLK